MDPSLSSAEKSTPHSVIPESEMLKLSEMLKTTFKGEIVGLVNCIVEGVVDGLQEQVKKLETTNAQLVEENELLHARIVKVSNGAKIRNRYNQVQHLTQDTNGKVTNSQKTPQTRAKRSALSQQVTTKHI